MKRWLIVMMLVVGIFSGCDNAKSDIDQVMVLRNTLLKSSCSFDAVITADYGDRLYCFTMANTADEHGNVRFEVREPETIEGITGEIAENKGNLTFDDKVLAFPLMVDGQITPVSAPWILIKTLRSGYIHACETTEAGLHVQIDDSYNENALRLDIWMDTENIPVRSEILYQGRRIITLEVENFTIM